MKAGVADRKFQVEVSAGGALVRRAGGEVEVLLIRVRATGYELPKGHVEPGETPKQAAARELAEETGVLGALCPGPELGTLEYPFERDGITVRKRVHYFPITTGAGEPLVFGPRPRRTRELRWVRRSEFPQLPLVNEELRTVIAAAYAAIAEEAIQLEGDADATGW